MGFFSAVKKWWKGGEDEQTPEVASQEVVAEVVATEEVATDEVVADVVEEPASVEVVIEEPTPEPLVLEEVPAEVITEPIAEEVPPVEVATQEPEPIVIPEIVEVPEVQEKPIIVEEVQEVSEEPEPVVEPIAEPEIIEEPVSEPEPESVIEEIPVVAEAPIIEEAPTEVIEEIEEPVLVVEDVEPIAEDIIVPISPRDMPAEGITEQIEPWQAELTLALRQAEPRLSVWLSHVLDGVEEVDENLWTRVRFFFKALEVPEQEAENFVSDFSRWLKAMDYYYVDDFRSELQYRLALALDLEDEEDERSRLMLKLSEGLARTREHIGRRIDSLLSSHERIDEAFWEELEEILITADVGYEPSMELVGRLRRRAQSVGTDDPEKFRDLLREELEEIFKGQRRIAAVNPPEVVLMIGVNGVGKTTTIAKLAYRARMQGKKVLIAAADTFRAAACEQLQVWAERVGAGFHTKGANADPAAVAYEAMDIAVAEGYDILFVDTAGRLHTKTNLMEELHKIRKVLGKKHAGAPHRSILVIDATTGQNALSQTKLFGEACGIDEIILTKLDGTAKGGVVVAVAMQFGIPITYIGLGEKMEDLRPFDGGDFAMALLGLDSKE